MKLVAIVLTFNESKHLARCLSSLEGVVDEVLVADCFSSDNTCEIAREYGAKVVHNSWVNHATQFNWALSQVFDDVDWVLRIDADEYLTPQLAEEISSNLEGLPSTINGVYMNRRMFFQQKRLRFGGVFPIQVLRMFRLGSGRCENRWMDEHIKVNGNTAHFKGELIDNNLNSLTWWIEKHNMYASREAVDLLNLKYGFMPHDSVASLGSGSQSGFKRWVKERVYAKLPSGNRAISYFLYRYIVRLGFLDGRSGFAFHFLQGFWYRYLVDLKINEVQKYMALEGVDITAAIKDTLHIDLQ